MALEVDLQSSGYNAHQNVLHDIQFAVEPGEVVGLIAPNGAGKSTLIKSILGIIKDVEGEMRLKDYAYIPERPIFYEGLTLKEHLDFLSSTLDISSERFNEKVEKLVRDFYLADVMLQYPESFSKGMQQKVMLVIAFLKEAAVYLIDEPFMGLDPKSMKKLLQYVERKKNDGAGILMTTHVLDTAEKVCDRFILLFNGSIVFQGTIKDIRKASGLKQGSLFDCFDVLTEDTSYVR
ncbi:ABC transporter ATP-binding protein [Thalassobacillus sp. CUG 92003]|uniref:ABC transporter ATP-binding protein n=1 Tax=Thalassobacillus sp. CUG 92003 TaxID=2736641 RepID=UPI0015E65065|nr:ABC transporter ATP-binding protein [Thalassobacillus sp. CUG 92003]